MKTNSIILLICTIVCFSLFGCTSPGNQNNSDLIHINLSGSFPVRDIRLEEIADIEFLQFETHEDFLFGGGLIPRIVTTDKMIVVNRRTGDIIVFSRTGKPISRFNRIGGGPEEFPQMWEMPIYDEATNEIFVISPIGIMVYSLTGEFKRRLPLLEGSLVTAVSYDSESLLLHDSNGVYPTPFSLISKKDGSIMAAIETSPITRLPRYVPISGGGRSFFPRNPIVRHNDGFLLDMYTSDTVFLFRNRELLPFLVRTPNIHSMNPVVILEYFIEAGNYQLLDTRRLVHLNEGQRPPRSSSIPQTVLIRNRKTGSIYRPRITFDDFRGKEVSIWTWRDIAVQNNSRLGIISLDLTELQDANDEGRLSGRLREIVENSEEDGNNIFMLLHFK